MMYIARLIASAAFLLAASSSLSVAQAPPTGGMNVEKTEERRRIFQNNTYPEIIPGSPADSESPAYSDPLGKLTIFIDPDHGYLKGLRFPALFGDALARSIDLSLIHISEPTRPY